MKTLLIPGLISDAHVWRSTQQRVVAATVADVTRQTSLAETAVDLLDRHPGPLVLVGHSMGGRVAMEMARLAPERIRAMALLSTGMHPTKEGEEITRQAMITLANNKGMGVLADKWLPGMMAQGIAPDPDVILGLKRMVMGMTPEVHERQMRALLGRPDASKTIGSYKGPMLLLVGRQDIWSPVAQHEEIQNLCPQAELCVIEKAGHFVPVEQPAATAEAIAVWLGTLSTSQVEGDVA